MVGQNTMPKDGFSAFVLNALFDLIFLLLGLAGLVTFANHLGSFTGIANLVFGLWMFSVVIGCHTIVRHYDKYFKKAIYENPDVDLMIINVTLPLANKSLVKLRLFRLVNFYLWPILKAKRYKKNKILKRMFADFDFKQHVNPFEKLLAYLFLLLTAGLVLVCIVYAYQVIVG